MNSGSPRSLRRAYLDWVEERVEEYKDRIPRADLLSLADEVITGLRVSEAGQYQLTELLLCQAVDRRIIRELKLPGYRAWARQRQQRAADLQHVIPLALDRLAVPQTPPAPVAAPARADDEEEPELRVLAVIG
jgi:hypothetical protein